MILHTQERDTLYDQLSSEQKMYLHDRLTRSRRTAFAQAIAANMGISVHESADPEDVEIFSQDWTYLGFIDAGHVNPELRCECGRPLRYQHRVENKNTGEIKRFGITHLQEHLGIQKEVVEAIIKNFERLDKEMDELLLKVKNEWQPESDLYQYAFLSADIEKHLQLGLPLLDNQIAQIEQHKRLAVVKKVHVTAASPDSDYKPLSVDLFTWDVPAEEESVTAYHGLLDYLQEPVKACINNGMRSARSICEILIRDYGASKGRFISGKPTIYPYVCWYIESVFPERTIIPQGTEDRHYVLKNNE